MKGEALRNGADSAKVAADQQDVKPALASAPPFCVRPARAGRGKGVLGHHRDA
jgi:hypothetical protein